jgi:hypothetical protein
LSKETFPNIDPLEDTLYGNTRLGIGCSFIALDFGHAWGLLEDAIIYMVTTSQKFNRRSRILLPVNVLIREGALSEFGG